MNNLSGILCIDKPAHQSSYDQIRQLVKQFDIKGKIGHAGTLDPFAEGLMILLIGQAVKVQDYFLKSDKVYQTELEFGFETDTLDITGEVANRSKTKIDLSKEELQGIIDENLSGKIKQVPPKFSAIKVKGKRAYELARNREDFSLTAREVTIYENKVLNWDKEKQILELKVHCSSGTYIRSLVRDLGNLLNNYATTKSIKRKQIGNFHLTSAKKISSLNLDSLLENVLPIEKVIPHKKIKLELDRKRINSIKNGNFQSIQASLDLGYNSIYHRDKVIIFLLKLENKIKVIFTDQF